MKTRISNSFSFKSARDLVRVGQDNDGGYLVSKSDIDKAEVLIGLGVNDDWSFESDFKKMKNVEVFAFDASVSREYFIKEFFKSLTRIDKPKLAFKKLKTILSYHRFFSNSSNHHIQKFVGLDSDDEIHCTFEQVLADIKQQNIFLKVDIEGSEYRFLEDLIAHQSRICGLVIELHDTDIHIKTILNFIKQFDLKLVHIHPNNYAPIRASDGLPTMLELTFSRHCKEFDEPSLPHKFDMPTGNGREEIQILVDS